MRGRALRMRSLITGASSALIWVRTYWDRTRISSPEACAADNGHFMIVFDNEGARFNYRVAAVMLHGQRVLLHRFETEEFWCLPGGRVEMLEPAAVSLRRE